MASSNSFTKLFNNTFNAATKPAQDALKKQGVSFTPYQANVSRIMDNGWNVGDAPENYGQAMASIMTIARTDSKKASRLLTNVHQLQSDPSSIFYNPYAAPTNRAVSGLKEYGIDASQLTDDWFAQNKDWQNYLIYNGTTNTPSKPGKKASQAENVAYQLYQYQKSEADTKKAEGEWAALQQELSYWAKRDDLNLTDEEILGKINWKNYSTLQKMDDTKKTSSPMELNRSIGYSSDAMLGTIWAARNNGGSQFSDTNIANYYLKNGNTYKANADIRAKRDITNKDTFSYSAGMMGDDLNDAGLYFDRATFDQQWIDDNRGILAGNDATAIKNYKAVVKAEQNTQQAESEAAQLKEALDKKLARYAGQKDGLDKAMAWLDSALKSGDYKMLQKMDSSIDSGIDIVSTTRGVDYAGRDMKKYVQDFFDALPQQSTGNDVVTSAISGVPTVTGAMQNRGQNIMHSSPVQTDATKSANDVDDALNAKVMGTYDAIEPQMTDGEQRYINNVPGVEYGRVFTQLKKNMPNMMNMLASGSAKGLADKALTSAEDNYRKTALDSAANRKRFEALQAERDRLYKEVSDAESAPDLGNQVSRTINGVEVAFEKDRNGQYTLIGNPANIEKAGVSKEDWQKEQRKLNMQSSYSHAEEIASIDMPENIQMDIDDGTHEGARLYFVFDPEEGEYVRDEMNMSTGSFYQGKPGGIPESVYGPYLDRINEQYRDVVAAREIVGDLTDEQRQSLSELTEKQAQLDQLEREYSAGLDEYNQQMNALNAAEKRYGIAGRLSHLTGGRVADRAADDTMINFVSNLMDFETPEATATSVAEYMDQQRKEYQIQHSSENASARMVKEANEYIAQNNEAIKDAQYVLQQLGSAAEGNDAGVQRYIQYLEKQNSDLADFVFSQSEGFADLAAEGRRIAQWETYGGTAEEQTLAFQVMDDYEKDLYYAHLAQDGAEGASAYFQRIDGTLLARAQGNIQSNAEERAQSGIGGRILNELAGIGISSLSVISSLGYVGDSIISGKSGSKWWQLPSLVSRTTHSEDIKAIRETYGDGIKGQIIEGVYDILYNRGRSAMVATTFGGLFPKGTSEIFQAMPIAATAMADSMEKAFDSNASLAQALGIGAATFLAESVTEGIELKNIKNAFGVGKNLTGNVVKEFLRDYIPNALPEVVGESLNDIIENAADRFIMGDKGEHAAAVQAYIDNGYSPDDAEAMATRDELGGVLHTALISFFSPGADIVAVGAGALQSHLYYANQARSINNLTGANFSARDLRLAAERQHRQMVEAQDATAVTVGRNAAQTQQNPQNAAQTQQEESALTAAPEAPAAPQASATDADIATLENARGANQTAVAASIASVLATDAPGSEHAAMAAASFFREQDIDTIEQVLDGAQEAGINPNTVKTGIQYAAMSADSASFAVMTSAEFEQADSQGKARMISEALVQDLNNPDIRKQVTDTIHQARVAEQEKALMADANESIMGEQQKVTDAQNAAQNAQSDLDAANKNLSDAQEALTAANHEYQESLNDPTADNAQSHNEKVVNEALNKVTNAVSETNAAQGRLDQAQANLQQVQGKADQVINDQRIAIHDQAEQIVAEQEAAEAQAQQEAVERANAEAEEQARLQAEEDERNGKAWEDRRDSLIETLLDQEYLEEGEERDRRRQELTERANQIKLGRIDMAGLMNNSEGYLAVSALSRRLNLPIQLATNMPETARGKYENGTVYLNANLIESGRMTVGQALVEATLHEITHSMQETKNYGTYRNVVLQSLFGGEATGTVDELYESNARFRAAVDQKISDYRRSVNQELTREQAEQEIVADFARTRLNDKDVVMRFLDQGLGGKIRNALHNINQMLKNFRLTGQERETAEYLRRAERTFQQMINEAARSSTHPEGEQFSIAQIAQSTGMTFDEKTLTLFDANGKAVDGVVNKITPDMIVDTPVGLLIRNGLSDTSEGVDENGNAKPSPQAAAMDMMAGLMNMVARYKDSNLVWEIGSSTLSSTFSALKSNSDPQYASTVDFGTVCAKTQAIIDVMSQVMLDRVSEGKYGGLTRDDIMKVYDATHNAGLSVPCPVCYVFSRWMGVPSLLGQMSQYQHDYVVTKKDADGKTLLDKNGYAVIDVNATQAKADKYIQSAEKYGDAKAINNRKTQLQNQRAKLEEQREKVTSKEEEQQLLDKMMELDKKIGEVSTYNWITQALCKKDKQTGKYVVDPKFKLTPDEILFDLNRTGEFARYEKNWRYRNTRGAGMGKAIMPYSGETIGDVLYGVKAKGRQNTISNPWLNMDPKAAARQLSNARTRAKKQNLVGGQRLQSTSDFRPEWGLDYVMSFLELQAAGSKVQMYTKVPEAVDFFASVGADVNLSIMGKGQGWHEDENGNKVLDFSSITGMKYETARELKNKYDNVQMILVGMNDTHIRLAMADSDIDFIIPWHSSGNSQDTLKKLIGSVGETLVTGQDYSTTQTDHVSPDRTEAQKALWDARMKLLTKGGGELNQEERNLLLSNPYTADLYVRFTEKGKDPDCYNVRLNKAQAAQIFPYEYWDTSSTKENADVNGKRFVEYCESMGIVPRFSQFKDDPGYWKLLIDRPMYNNDGSYHRQQVIDVTNARIGELDNSGKLTGSDLPTSAQAKYASSDPRSEHYAEYTEMEKRAIENAKAAIDQRYDDGTNGQYSVYGDVTTADMEQMLSETNDDYQSAVKRGDMDAAAQDVESYAESKGYTDRAYHGTNVFGFTEFDPSVEDQIFVAYDEQTAGTYTRDKNVRPVSEGSSFNYTELLADNDKMAALAKEKLTNLYGTPVRDVRFRNSTELRQMADSMLQERILKPLEGVKWENEDARIGDIQAMAHRTGVDESYLEQANTPAELEQLLYEHYADEIDPNDQILLTGDKIKQYLSPVLTFRGGMSPSETRGLFWDINQRLIDSKHPFGMFEFDIANRGNIPVYYDQRWVLDHIVEANGDKGGIYSLYTRPGNQLVVDADGARWNQISVDWQDGTMSTRDIAQYAKENGYDSVRINNVRDNGNYREEGVRYGESDIGIFFNQDDVKSADPVTRDEHGNVIPLSQRFTDNSDIRYSDGGASLADLDQPLIDSGIVTQEDIDAYNANNPGRTVLEGQNPLATTAGGEAQRAFGQGMLQDNDEMDAFVKRYVANQNGYTPDSNSAQIDRAIQWIRSNKASSTSDGLYESIEKVTSNRFDYRSADGQARMVALMGMAAYKNDVMAQVSLADAFNRQGTDLGRALQARKLFRLMTPEGRIGTLRRMMEKTQQETGNEDLKFSEWIYRAAAAAETEDDFKKVQKSAAKELAEQLPASWKDRLQAIRMLSMLANPRTHVRNIIGNSVFIPAVGLKNKLAAVMELGMDQGQRTKTLSPILSRDAREFSRRDALAMKDVLTGEAKYNEDNAVKREQKPFKGVLQMLMDFNSNALEGEDWFFLKGHYRRALGSWMMANGYNSAQLEANPQLLEAGRAYAIEEAQKATYRDFSQIASTLNQVSRKGGVAGFIVDAALPFKKTPANILKRGLEYSPFGIAKALTADAKHLHDYLKYQSGKTKIMPEDAITPTQFIDHLCAGLSGTAIMAIGALLGHMGMASCGLDDDDDKLQTMQGEQPYALNIRNIVNGIAGFELMGENVTYTVDWAAPMSMPFFVGVAIMEQLERERSDFDIGEMINAAGAIAEPVFNLSMLDGVNSLFETSQYDDTNTITQIGAKIATNYLSSYVPSVVGAVTRSFVDPIRRKAYVKSGEGTGIMGTARYAWEQFENKIPGLSESNIPYRDAWGEYKDEGVLKKAFENFLSPGYLSITEEDGVVDELARLYESTGDAKMIPEMPGKKIKDMVLSAEQYDQLTVERGQMAKSLLTDLMTTGYYQNAADEDKASMVRDVWTYANQNANHSINEDVKLDSWVLNSRSNPVHGIINRSASTIGKETANGYVNAGVEAVQKGDWDSLDVCMEKLAELKAEGITPGKTIRAKVTEIYKPEYVRAYQDDDYARMEEIEETLTDSELGYKESDFTKWITAADEQVNIEDE